MFLPFSFIKMNESELKYVEIIESSGSEDFSLKDAVKLYIKLKSLEDNKFVPPVAKINSTYSFSHEEKLFIFELIKRFGYNNLFGYYLANVAKLHKSCFTEKLLVDIYKHDKETSVNVIKYLDTIFTLFCIGIYIPSTVEDPDVLFKNYKQWIIDCIFEDKEKIKEPSIPKIILPS